VRKIVTLTLTIPGEGLSMALQVRGYK